MIASLVNRIHGIHIRSKAYKPEKFKQAMEYENEKEGFTWNQNESLSELIQPERIDAIKTEYLNRKNVGRKSSKLIDNDDLMDAESEGCAACFI